MLYVLRDYIIYANALYAKEESFLTYEEINEYKVLLYRGLKEKYKYILFDSPDKNIIEVKEHVFVRENDGVLSVHDLNEEFIESLNSVYPEEFHDIIKQSRQDYRGKVIQKKK